MPIVGFRFTSLEGKRLEDTKTETQIKVNSTPRVTMLKEVDIPTFRDKALSLDFEFTTTYEPKLAEIKIKGNILYLSKDNESVLKSWKKDKKLPDEMNIEILNNLFRKCLVKISSIAEDLQLPPPLQMPRVRVKDDTEGKGTGYVG